MKRLLRATLFLIPAPFLCAATTITISSNVVVPSVKRFGVNLGQVNYFDSGQIMKELVFRNPGFEGQLYQSVIHCASGSATTCVDDIPFASAPPPNSPPAYTVWPAGYWNDATYEVIYGAAKGRHGTIATFSPPASGHGSTFVFSDSGTTVGAGDYLVVRMRLATSATDGWTPQTGNNATITTELSDLFPGTAGRQAARFTAANAGQTASLTATFDSSLYGPFVLMNGSFRLAFKAKGTGGSNAVAIALRRGSTSLMTQTVNLSSSWSAYSFDFTANDPATASPLTLVFTATASSFLLDDVSLRQTNTDGTNPTAYRDAVVNALRLLKPGIIRRGQSSVGDSLDNELATLYARVRTGFSTVSTTQPNNLNYLQDGLHELLELCDTVHAEPWIIVPTTFSTDEMKNLVEYLGGPSSTPYGAIRAARGRAAPWTDAFALIHLEFGNEIWNCGAGGACMSDDVAHGARTNEIFAAARTSPYFIASRFDLVLGGWDINPSRNRAMHDASANHDSFSIGPYISHQVDTYATNEDLFGPLFAEPEMLSAIGYVRQDADVLRTSARPVPVNVYELNMHTQRGSIPQDVLDAFTPSLGAGLAIADHMLLMLRELGARDQMVHALTEYLEPLGTNRYVLLFSILRDAGVTDRKRPQFLALQLANTALSGDLLQTTLSGDNPTWNQPLVNFVQYSGAHYLQAFAFANGVSRSLIVFNLHRTAPLTVTFAGANAPNGTVSMSQLTSASPRDTNETRENVVITTPSYTTPLTLPPFSMTVLKWGTPVWRRAAKHY